MSAARSLRVLVLAAYPESAPSTRVRVSQFIPRLAEAGIEVTLHPFLDEAGYRAVRRGGGGAGLAVVRAARRLVGVLSDLWTYDVVWVQRGVAPALDLMVLRALRDSGKPLVFDFDDAVFLPQEGGRGWIEGLRRPGSTTRAYCRAAAVVLAGNPHLAEYARGAVGGREAHRVRLLPSVVDTDRLVPPSGPRPGPPTLGWAGSDSTVPYLETLAPALRELASRVVYRLLVVAGDRRPALPGVDFEMARWSEEGELGNVQQMDLGLYPLEDTPWSRGKCGFKALQYLACGVPCVASPVGVLTDIVVPGSTGLLASTAGEWVQACAGLLEDPEARVRMGTLGRAKVQQEYSVDAVLPRLAEALEHAASGSHA